MIWVQAPSRAAPPSSLKAEEYDVDPSVSKAARKKAMQLLEFRDRTESELRERLQKAGFTETDTEDALEYVRSFNYINDLRYAENYILSRMAQKSRQKILQELAQKGISRDTALAAWENASEDQEIDERTILAGEIRKKYAPGSSLTAKQTRSLYGFLARRGFHFEDITSVLHSLQIETE